MTATLPIARDVGTHFYSSRERTQKGLFRWINDNAHVSRPDDQIPFRRPIYTLEAGHSAIENARRLVTIVDSDLLEQRVDEVRAVERGFLNLQSGRNHGLTYSYLLAAACCVAVLC